nr:alpha/beta hydrolases superfamily protein [Tanacetum cinerariifolium]
MTSIEIVNSNSPRGTARTAASYRWDFMPINTALSLVENQTSLVEAKVERKSLALKAKKESSDEECSTSGSEDEEYAIANGKSDRKCFRCNHANHLIGECPKPPKDKNQRVFVGGSWSDTVKKMMRRNTPSPQPTDPFLDDPLDVPSRPSNPLPLQSNPYLDITISLSPITPFDNMFETPSPPQPPLMGYPIYFNILEYHEAHCLCCFYNRNLILSLKDEMHFLFSHIEYRLTSAIALPFPPHH